MPRALSIEVISDVVCPWCFIGLAQLERAVAARPDLEVAVSFSPFQLDPSTPREGVDLRERLRQKYGGDPALMFARVSEAARRAGLEIDFEKVRRSVNTLGAHTLLERASTRGTQVALARALFEAYFLEGRDVGDPEVLVELATAHGFTAEEARALLDDETERARVTEVATRQVGRGVRGVPFFVVEGRHAVSGAQDAETWGEVFAKLAPRGDAPAAEPR